MAYVCAHLPSDGLDKVCEKTGFNLPKETFRSLTDTMLSTGSNFLTDVCLEGFSVMWLKYPEEFANAEIVFTKVVACLLDRK